MTKVTPWFPASIKPVRVGEYECRLCVEDRALHQRHFWTGEKWVFGPNDTGPSLNVIWRGLTKRHHDASGSQG